MKVGACQVKVPKSWWKIRALFSKWDLSLCNVIKDAFRLTSAWCVVKHSILYFHWIAAAEALEKVNPVCPTTGQHRLTTGLANQICAYNMWRKSCSLYPYLLLHKNEERGYNDCSCSFKCCLVVFNKLSNSDWTPWIIQNTTKHQRHQPPCLNVFSAAVESLVLHMLVLY